LVYRSSDLEDLMTSIRLSTAVAIVPLFFFSPAASRAQNPSSGNEADTAAIKQLVANYSEAFNRHDAHAIGMLFADDADFTNLRGMSRHGRQEIEPFFGTLFTGILKNAQRTDSVRSLRFLSPEIAAVDTDCVITGSKSPTGAENPPRKGLLELIVTKQSGQWLITLFHEQDLPPAPGSK
jgi:uncharacterized protein (TIGR02246 family)